MSYAVSEVNLNTVLQYVALNAEVSEDPWVEAVMNPKTIRLILCNGTNARDRKAYGLFIGETMIGYAVVHGPTQTLDLLHVAEDFRGLGYGYKFLKELNIQRVVLDARNIRATNLYTQLGYELEFFEEE